MSEEYSESQGDLGGQGAGNSADVTVNSSVEESPATGGTDTHARGVTGTGNHGTDEREGIGRAAAITDPEEGENRPG